MKNIRFILLLILSFMIALLLSSCKSKNEFKSPIKAENSTSLVETIDINNVNEE